MFVLRAAKPGLRPLAPQARAYRLSVGLGQASNWELIPEGFKPNPPMLVGDQGLLAKKLQTGVHNTEISDAEILKRYQEDIPYITEITKSSMAQLYPRFNRDHMTDEEKTELFKELFERFKKSRVKAIVEELAEEQREEIEQKAIKTRDTAAITADLERVVEFFKTQPHVRRKLESVQDKHEVVNVLNVAFKNMDKPPSVDNQDAMRAVMHKVKGNRTQFIEDTLTLFSDLSRYEKKIMLANITSATELSADHKKRLEAAIKKRIDKNFKLELSFEVEPAVLGGLRLIVSGHRVDFTVEKRLNAYKQIDTFQH